MPVSYRHESELKAALLPHINYVEDEGAPMLAFGSEPFGPVLKFILAAPMTPTAAAESIDVLAGQLAGSVFGAAEAE